MLRPNPRILWLPTVLSAAGMFTLSYIWHSTMLNDLKDIGDDMLLYLCLSISGYVLLGLLMSIFQLGLLRLDWIDSKENPTAKMMLLGLLTGLVLGWVLLALTLPLKGRVDPAHVWVDLAWQVIEQGAGGMLAAFGLLIHQITANLEREGAL
jgi:hypothetical protein